MMVPVTCRYDLPPLAQNNPMKKQICIAVFGGLVLVGNLAHSDPSGVAANRDMSAQRREKAAARSEAERKPASKAETAPSSSAGKDHQAGTISSGTYNTYEITTGGTAINVGSAEQARAAVQDAEAKGVHFTKEEKAKIK